VSKGEGEIVRLLLGDGALVGAGLGLIEQNIAQPAKLGSNAKVIEAGGGIVQFVQDQQIMTPGNFCDNPSQK
jgi:hypothetical protein